VGPGITNIKVKALSEPVVRVQLPGLGPLLHAGYQGYTVLYNGQAKAEDVQLLNFDETAKWIVELRVSSCVCLTVLKPRTHTRARTGGNGVG
jgi:hypothetical protein